MLPFATVRLEGLLEPRDRGYLKNHSVDGDREDSNCRNGPPTPRHVYISPALYVTPEQSPIPDHPSAGPIFASPYVVNHKHRRGRIETGGSAGELPDLTCGNEEDVFGLEEVVGDNFINESSINANEDGNGDDDDDDEGFLDMRVGSEVENRSIVSDQVDFFDAIEDFSSDASVSNIPLNGSTIESELCAMKFSLIDEIERRKIAEESIVLMRGQWERIGNILSQAGLTFPALPASDNMLLEENSIDQLLQEVVVGRFVAESIGRGQARAEAEEAAATVIESKDHEITRLRERLHYYETVTHEMSQRKLVEVAVRQQWKKRRSRGRWMWGFMGFTVSVVASYIAYSYGPRMNRFLSSMEPGDSTD